MIKRNLAYFRYLDDIFVILFDSNNIWTGSCFRYMFIFDSNTPQLSNQGTQSIQ